MAESPVDLPETATIPTTAIERLAYAGGRVADEVTELREVVDRLTNAVTPVLGDYRAELQARQAERLAFTGARTKFWRALSQPTVMAAIVAALLAGLGFGTTGERMISAALGALSAPAPGTTTIEVHDAP